MSYCISQILEEWVIPINFSTIAYESFEKIKFC